MIRPEHFHTHRECCCRSDRHGVSAEEVSAGARKDAEVLRERREDQTRGPERLQTPGVKGQERQAWPASAAILSDRAGEREVITLYTSKYQRKGLNVENEAQVKARDSDSRPDFYCCSETLPHRKGWCLDRCDVYSDSNVLSRSIFRKLREAMNAQKNAERAAMRAHFRRKYQLTKVNTHRPMNTNIKTHSQQES